MVSQKEEKKKKRAENLFEEIIEYKGTTPFIKTYKKKKNLNF